MPTDVTNTPSIESGKRRNWPDGWRLFYVVVMAFCFCVAACMDWRGNKLETSLFALAVLPPGMMILMRSWNRFFHSERAPIRVQYASELGHIKEWAGLAFFLATSCWLMVLIAGKRHPDAQHAFSRIALVCALYGIALQHYLDDRKPVLRIRQTFSSDPASRVFKPIVSDHWGQGDDRPVNS